ncbi:Polycystin cation channel [Phytophthora infestans]|uniref:Polycystin cation channel n=1 Tax=Phytophthora infestans TaxID=4787 RepID=A0A833WUQ7_PHYIN|nr:Polycystin cation channel [Phytophthora infestans]
MKALPSFVTSMAAMPKPRPIGIPQTFLLRDLKEKRKFRLLSRKLLAFITFVSIYLTALLMDRNISGRSVVQNIVETELLKTPQGTSSIVFNDITSVNDFWDWFINSFLSIMYSGSGGSEAYTLASHTVILGGFHLWQTRYAALNFSDPNNKGSSCYSDTPLLQNKTCYSTKQEAIEDFGITDGTNESSVKLQSLDMFSYSTDNNSDISGYQTFFLRSTTNGANELAKANSMQQYGWLDRQTKEVVVVLALYNPSLRVLSIVHLTIDFNLAGGVTPSSDVLVLNLEPYDFNAKKNIVRVILEALFIGHVAYFALLELWDVCVLSGGNYRIYIARYGLMNNIGDWGNILVNVAIIIWRYCSQKTATRQKLLKLKTFDEYINPLPLMIWDRILLGLNLLNILLLTARALKYFQVTKGGRRLMRSVYGAMPEVISFIPIYFSVIVGYSFAGHMLYGLNFTEWATFPRAFFRVFELNFGLYDPGPIYDQGGIFSAIFIYTGNTVFCILMLNIFMAIVMSTWERLSEQEADRAEERDQFSRGLGFTDVLFLMAMKEDHVDALIDVAIQLEGDKLITRNLFCNVWDELDDDEVPEWTVSRVLGWYWDRNDLAATASGLSASTQALASFGSTAAVSKALSKFSVAAANAKATSKATSPTKYAGRTATPDSETEEEAVEVVNTARDLDTRPPPVTHINMATVVNAFAVPTLPWGATKPTTNAKVGVDG